MADGKTVSSYEYNVDVTRRVVEMAHCIGVSVEGELGCLGSLETMRGDKEDGHGTDAVMTREQLLTDPDQAADFVKATQLDALAIAIGTSHGVYKFTRKPTGETLDPAREGNPRTPPEHPPRHARLLVRAAGIPRDDPRVRRRHARNVRRSRRRDPGSDQHGVRKVNIDTDIRLAMTAAVRQFLAQNPSKFDPRDFLKVARKAATELCKARYL